MLPSPPLLPINRSHPIIQHPMIFQPFCFASQQIQGQQFFLSASRSLVHLMSAITLAPSDSKAAAHAFTVLSMSTAHSAASLLLQSESAVKGLMRETEGVGEDRSVALRRLKTARRERMEVSRMAVLAMCVYEDIQLQDGHKRLLVRRCHVSCWRNKRGAVSVRFGWLIVPTTNLTLVIRMIRSRGKDAHFRVTSLNKARDSFGSYRILPSLGFHNLNRNLEDSTTDSMLKMVEHICARIETTIQEQGKTTRGMESDYHNAMLAKFDSLISTSQKMNHNLEDVILKLEENRSPRNNQHEQRTQPLIPSSKPTPKKHPSFVKPPSYQDPLTPGRRLQRILSLEQGVKVQQPEEQQPLTVSNNLVPSVVSSLHDTFKFCSPVYGRDSTCEKLLPIFKRLVELECSEEVIAKELNIHVGGFFNKTAEHYFQEYSSGRMMYDDMKVKFSGDVITQLIDISERWMNFCLRQPVQKMEKCVITGRDFYRLFDSSAKSSLDYLIHKYPPIRAKQINTQLLQRIKQIPFYSIVKYDILRNSGMEFGFEEKQKDFSKEIKKFLNALISESKSQFPLFKQTMKSIFSGEDCSVDGSGRSDREMEYQIGAKIPDTTPLYTEEELTEPGLPVKNPQILRILSKWCQELVSYFVKTNEKILENKLGFKSMKHKSIHICIPRSKLKALAHKLHLVFQDYIQRQKKSEVMNIGSIIEGLIIITLGGVEGYEFVDQKEITLSKLAEYLYETFKSYMLVFLNLALEHLVKVRFDYPETTVERHINLITFGVVDLLRCRCVGNRQEIQRIYNDILVKNDYFEVIRVKNKLNSPTRDVLINLKFKRSFLICEVQLSLGRSHEEINNFFCHYLYELQRSSFGVIFECATQISHLDPKMSYVKKQQNMRFKVDTPIHERIKTRIEVSDAVYCSCQHKRRRMDLMSNDRPYCCLGCMSFVAPFTLRIPHFRCSTCGASLCFKCSSGVRVSSNLLLKELLVFENFNPFQIPGYFLMPQYLGPGPYNKQQIKLHLEKALEQHEYVILTILDKVGYSQQALKICAGEVTQTFMTLPEMSKVEYHAVDRHLSLIIPVLPTQRRSINQLQVYRKYHFNKNWDELERILATRNIKEVMCIVNEEHKTVLIVDIPKCQQAIEVARTDKELKRVILSFNELRGDYIELTSKGLDDISEMTEIHHKDTLKTLNLWENNIQNTSVLLHFPNIEELYLEDNRILSLYDILHMRHLQLLICGSNQITGKIPPLHMPCLLFLTLTDNNIDDVSNLTLSTIPNLLMLKLDHNPILTLPALNLPRLEYMLANTCKIKDLKEFFGSNLPNLSLLDLSHNQFEAAVPELEWPELRTFDVSGNRLKDVQRFGRSSLGVLEELDMSYNEIGGNLYFKGSFPSLRVLNFSHNNIQSLDSLTFGAFPYLEVLMLDNNQIANPLSHINLKSIKRIDLSFNKISDICEFSTSELPSLSQLLLDHNQISTFYPFFRCSLLTLDLSFNQLHNINLISTWKSSCLQQLLLNNNKISTTIPRLQFYSLKHIDLSQNLISDEMFSETMQLLPKLERANLTHNLPKLAENMKRKYPEGLGFFEYSEG